MRNPIHGLRSELFTAELFDLLMTGHKISVSNTLFTSQSTMRTCPKMTCEKIHTICCVKNTTDTFLMIKYNKNITSEGKSYLRSFIAILRSPIIFSIPNSKWTYFLSPLAHACFCFYGYSNVRMFICCTDIITELF